MKKIVKIFIHIIRFTQVCLSGLVFVVALFWLLDLAGINFLSPLIPFMDSISHFVRIFYHQEIVVGDEFFDGTLLFFDLLMVITIYLLFKLKEVCMYFIEELEYEESLAKKAREDEFNKQLHKELEKKISKLDNIAILVELKLKNHTFSNIWHKENLDGIEEKTNEVFKFLHDAMLNVPDCKMAKTDNKMLILNNKFINIEKILDTLTVNLSLLQTKYKKQRWLLTYYIGIELYEKEEQSVKDIYPLIQNLIDLQVPNEILVSSNFNIRYNMFTKQTYELSKKGEYKLRSAKDDVCIWRLVKKF
ncbi:hypothetical protein J6E39_07760 [bacterium]|nr:hypothetical protein [bacterium]